MITDNAQRRTALNPAESYIVQAPAGSGKTELLTQRYLRLLAQVTLPEQILAITFTRKAAAEMRQRVLAALARKDTESPETPHQALTWQLAQAAREQDAAQGWYLCDNPHRLRLQTFDSLAAELTRQMPVLAELGAQPAVTEQAGPVYQQAARATLASLTEADMAPHLSAVLRHLDNQAGQLERLICRMLPRREQWLPSLLQLPDVSRLEIALQAEIEQDLQRLVTAWEPALLAQATRLARFAALHVSADHVLRAWLEPPESLLPEWSHLHWWCGLAALLLTVRGEWRKTVDKRVGFPSPKTPGMTAEERQVRQMAKADIRALLVEMTSNPLLQAQLAQVPYLPTTGYQADQVALLGHLRVVLLRAAAELRLVFQATGEVDFAELQQRAIQALGAETAPTDLALVLDHRIRHILIDEFQDTSISQYRLLCLLTTGWQPGDGRTLFVVGDPMQSIYRFREAEVGLYLRTRDQGLGDLVLTPLILQMNFRSTPGIVNWVNQTFQVLFPTRADPDLGAVAYAPSQAAQATEPLDAVHWHPQIGRDDEAEAQQIAALIRTVQQQQSKVQIAVLVRSRQHLTTIAAALASTQIRYQAVDVDPLQHRPVVQDLRSLTGALLHPADRLAWLALLRTPWVGLSLADLLTIAESPEPLIYAALQHSVVQARLSPDGLQRVQRLLRLLQPCIPYRARQPLSTLVEGAWLALGGCALADAAGVADAQAYFNLLAQIVPAHGLPDSAGLDEQLARLYAAPDPQADGCVQLMTLHAAKGLEFDVVILPGLGRRTRRNTSELLYWQERTQSTAPLLIAPIRAAATAAEPIADYIAQRQQQQEQLETVRLLYVAATRARQQLHLFGHGTCNNTGLVRPAAGSLLHTLWPLAEPCYANLAEQDAVPEPAAKLHARTEQRLPADWQLMLPQMQRQSQQTPGNTSIAAELTSTWVADTARHIGTLVHRYLERVGHEGLDQWSPERLTDLRPALQVGLAHLGVTTAELTSATDTVCRALHNTLTDTRGRWILQAHQAVASEWALTWQQPEEQPGARHYVIDRTFIDEAGTRWIIDYKTAEPGAGQSLADFMAQQQAQYQDQLYRYGQLISQMEHRPIQLALYFPLCCGWQTWAWTADT